MGSTCGLFAVNHILLSAAAIRCHSHLTIKRKDFEARGLASHLGENAASLVQLGGSNYDLAVLHANLDVCGIRLIPMLPADLEGSTTRTSQVAGSRFGTPFMQHVLPEGSIQVAGYILRLPASGTGGHWVAVLPATILDVASSPDVTGILCDSRHPSPVLVRAQNISDLLQACALDMASHVGDLLTDFGLDWGCFLIGVPR